MNLKKLAAFGGVILGLVGNGYAAELVCVDNQRIFELSSYAKSVQEQILKKRQELMSQFQNRIREIQQKITAVEQQIKSGLLSEEAVKQKREELAKLQEQLQRLVIQSQQEWNAYMQQEYEKLGKLEKAALEALSKTMGFKAVVDCQMLIYHSPEVDVTEQTAKVIDQLAKKVK